MRQQLQSLLSAEEWAGLEAVADDAESVFEIQVLSTRSREERLKPNLYVDGVCG